MSGSVRAAAVAGSFYPGSRSALAALAADLLAEAASPPRAALPVGLLVPHAGLDYSGAVAAAAWTALRTRDGATGDDEPPLTAVVLGTNHRAGWLDGIAAWDRGAWRTPLGDVLVDNGLAAAIVDLGPPFLVDRDAHDGEHSIEVQLPLLQVARPAASVVPLAVSAGVDRSAIDAGQQLGELLGRLRAEGAGIVLVISTDMAHYPPAAAAEEVTEALVPAILAAEPAALAAREAAVRGARIPGLVCGMCGIEPSVVGLAALRAMGATAATRIAAATSADRGGPAGRTVGYLAVRFDT